MIYLIFLIIIVLALSLFWVYGKKPYMHKNIALDDLKSFLEVLLFRGYDGGFISICIPDREEFLQFSKYIISENSIGLQLDFPLAKWSKHYYDSLKKLLIDQGIKFETQTTSKEEIPEFLVVDIKQDLDFAQVLIKQIIQSIYKLNNVKVNLHFENVSPRNEKILHKQ
jgi:hypothetical protein